MEVTVFTDYACPFCYIAYRMYRKLQEETGFRFTPVYMEIHSDMPGQGVPSERLFPEERRRRMNEQLRVWGEPYGITPQIGERLSSSRLAILTRAALKLSVPEILDTYDESVYAAYQTGQQDIGKEEVLEDILRSLRIGMRLPELLSDPCAEECRIADDRTAALWSVHKTPSFVIGGKCFRGLMKEEELRAVLAGLAK